MKTSKTTLSFLLIVLLSICWSNAQGQEVIYVKIAEEQLNKEQAMKTFLIEREIPQAGELSSEQLKGISQKSCAVLKELGPRIQWVHSYVTEDKVYCLYRAANEELIREHAGKGGFPVNYITELSTTIDPTTAN